MPLFLAACPAAAQQWIAVRLHPEGAYFSQVYAVAPGVQGGWFQGQTGSKGVLWHGANTGWTSLADGGVVLGIWGGVQVGDVNGQASLWTGTAQSRVNLYPLEAATALAVRGDMQAGTAIVGNNHAALWRGTAASFVDLHPAGAWESIARATDGVLQGGFARWDLRHATIWSGTPQSVVDLHPAGAGESEVWGMAPGIQVGWATFPSDSRFHSGVWHGTAASFQDFNPPGGSIRLFATTGRVHVGQGALNSQTGAAHAVLNFGTPNAWLDLRPFLPPGYGGFSAANAVYQDGDTIYVGGYAFNSSGNEEAFLWIGTVPCYANCDGSTAAPALNVSDFICFLDRYAAADPVANCDHSTAAPTLNIADFICFLNRYAAGCP